jgi:hypothetical protein
VLTAAGLAGRLARLKPAPLWPSRCLSLAVVLCAAQVPLAVLFCVMLWAGVGVEFFPVDPYPGLFLSALVMLTFLVWAGRYWREHVLQHPQLAAALATPLRAVPSAVVMTSGLAVLGGNWLRWSWLQEASPEPIFVAALLGAPLLALVGVAWNHCRVRWAERLMPVPDGCAVGGPLLLDPARAVCQVCGSELGAEPVACDRCLAPYHADCWKYAGRCATYGCGGTRRMN